MAVVHFLTERRTEAADFVGEVGGGSEEKEEGDDGVPVSSVHQWRRGFVLGDEEGEAEFGDTDLEAKAAPMRWNARRPSELEREEWRARVWGEGKTKGVRLLELGNSVLALLL